MFIQVILGILLPSVLAPCGLVFGAIKQGCSLGLERLGLETFFGTSRLGLESLKNGTSQSRFGLEG